MKNLFLALTVLYSVASLAKVDMQRLEADAKWRSESVNLESDRSGYKIVLHKIADVKTIRDPNAYVTKTVSIPVIVTYRAEGIDRSLRLSFAGKKGWVEGKFSHLQNLRVSDLFEQYDGSVSNVGVGILGLRSTRAKSHSGAVLSQLNLESPLAGLGNEAVMNVGFTNLNYEVVLKPKSNRAVTELVLSENGRQTVVSKTIDLKELNDLPLVGEE